MNADIEATCSSNYKMPKDPSNKLAISIEYYFPFEFTSTNSGLYSSIDKWGNEEDYRKLIDNFINLKNIYIDKGIPFIIVEV